MTWLVGDSIIATSTSGEDFSVQIMEGKKRKYMTVGSQVSNQKRT